MITDESLTVSEAVQWCAGAISHREATRLRHLTAGPQQPGDSSWGVVAFRWFMTLKTQVHCRRVGVCLEVVADVKDISRLDQRRVGQTSIVHTMIIFRCDQRGFATSAELTRTSKSCASRR
jgi:hypothetical protein